MKKMFVLGLVVLMLLVTSVGVFAIDAPTKDIVDTAIAADDFEILVAAIVEAELVDVLKGEGPFTVSAPTDAAFAAVLADLGITAEELLARDDLADILLYRVVSGKVMATDVVNLDGEEHSNGRK